MTVFGRYNLKGGAPSPLLFNPIKDFSMLVAVLNLVVFMGTLLCTILVINLNESCVIPLFLFIIIISFLTLLTALQFIKVFWREGLGREESWIQYCCTSDWTHNCSNWHSLDAYAALPLLHNLYDLRLRLLGHHHGCTKHTTLWGQYQLETIAFSANLQDVQVNQCFACEQSNGAPRPTNTCQTGDACVESSWKIIKSLDECPNQASDIICELQLVCYHSAPVMFGCTVGVLVIYIFLLGTTSSLVFGKFIPSILIQSRELANFKWTSTF